jgi:signal transduction histidine kinase
LSKPRLSVAESLLGVVLRRKKPLQVQNVQISAGYQNVEVARREGLVSLLSVPLLFQGQAIGTLSVYTAQPYSFSNEETRILSALAELSAIAIEKARLYERLVDAEESLRQNEKLSALGLIAAEVAHEIRNPLTVMKMLYHSLDLHFPPGDPRAKDARILAEKIDHLNKFVDRILALSRTNEPSLAPVNLNELIEELNLLVRHKLQQQQVELVRHLEPDLPLTTGDSGQLEQAFLNLLLNAAEAMPHGGTLTITTRVVPPEPGAPLPPQLSIEFQDTGRGMDSRQRRNALGPVLRSRKAKGAGLGLAVVSRIVEAHHGRLEIKSRAGKGTTVTVLLPMELPPAGESLARPKEAGDLTIQ